MLILWVCGPHFASWLIVGKKQYNAYMTPVYHIRIFPPTSQEGYAFFGSMQLLFEKFLAWL